MSEIPAALCQCGCGGRTRVPTQNHSRNRETKGIPLRFLSGHNTRLMTPTGDGPNPGGMCKCGCGQKAPLAHASIPKKGWIIGKPISYILGHRRRPLTETTYREEDRGYKTPCWIWLLSTNKSTGRPQIRDAGRMRIASRVYYEKYKGSIPVGMEVDHLCFVPLCVNPDHLEAVTKQENLRRMRLRKKGNA